MDDHEDMYEGSPFYALLHDHYGDSLPHSVARRVAVEHGCEDDYDTQHSGCGDWSTLAFVQWLGY